MTDSECQRFYAFSKRVPKDVKRYCGICRQHEVLLETRGHQCAFKDCRCTKCELVRTRRQIMSQQIRLRRAQDKRFQRTNEPTQADVVPICQTTDESNPLSLMDAKQMCYFCQKCKNHEVLVWKKQHKRQCPFTDCPCDKCELIETRRRLDQHIKKRKAANESTDDQTSGSHSPKSIRLETSEEPESSISPFASSPNSSESSPIKTTESTQFQTVCIPVFLPVPTPEVDATRLTTSELFQRAAAQHFASSQVLALQPPTDSFTLVSNEMIATMNKLNAEPTFCLTSDLPVVSIPAFTLQNGQVDPMMASLIQNACIDFDFCENGLPNFQQFQNFVAMQHGQHTI